MIIETPVRDLFAPFPIPVVTHRAQATQTAPVIPEDIEGKIARAETAITSLFASHHAACVSWSAGKDSSLLLSLVLNTAAKLKGAGRKVPPILVMHSSTLVENPEMSRYAESEMLQVAKFASEHKLDVTIEVAYPNLASQWSVRVIGGRALPTFPATNRDCSIDWKAKPLLKLRKKVLKQLQREGKTMGEPVVLLGTRYEESAERSRNMQERGESDVQIRRGIDENGKPSHLFLSPICWWSTDDVWEYLGMANAGAMECYSDFEETFRVYADSMGTSCVIVAEDMYKSIKASKPCSARTGCSICTAVTVDKSMENMLANETRYAYMRGLNNLRNFLSNTRWDMDRRSWLGRTINDGYIRISPDAYSPAMMEDLLKYALTIDVVEQESARAAGLPMPRFQLVGLQQLFAIDAMWSLQAYHRPFHALKIYRDIVERGMRFQVPLLAPYDRPKSMSEKFIYVGADWDEGDRMAYTGLRSAVHELAAMDSDGCMGSRTLNDGREVLAINTDDLLSFDEETAAFLLDMELDELIEKHHDNPRSSPTQAYFYYASLGVMSVKAGAEGEIDKILRRSNFKVRNGLAGQQDPQALMARAMTAEEAGLQKKEKVSRARGEAGSLSTLHQDLLVEEVDEETQHDTPQC
ncbi:phosphoadenosine phosphosulfate reductase family protein [Polaromonas sp.]|uniref:phosphoadenosine phosphosulfate reductase domain-containing protein n=1 Tax=Polaromonas sp. TaxID=1869339 RepID=UPI00352B27FE